MENASKALYMAAAILISLMILSIFVVVFREGAKFGEKYETKQNQGQIELFNSRFEDFQRENNTISDIITVTNLANDVNEDAAYNKKMSVTIDVEIENVYFSVTPEYGIERNYIYIGKSDSITNSSNKIYSYDLMNIKKENLKKYSGTPPTKTNYALSITGLNFKNGDILSKVNNEMDYKYYFKCTDLRYHNTETDTIGRVSYMNFVMYPNPDYVE